MSVTVQCGCGKRVGLSDALIGKTIKCPRCSQEIFVSASARTLGAPPRKDQPTLHISNGLITLAVITLLIIAGIVTFIRGPLHVYNQWESISPKAAGEISDVVSFALQAYMSENQLYNPTKSAHTPGVDGDIYCKPPFWALSMPEKVQFGGMTTQGRFGGFYHPATGEIEAEITYGGMEVGGLMVVHKEAGSFHITGRDPGGTPQAEINGKSLKIIYPPKDVPY